MKTLLLFLCLLAMSMAALGQKTPLPEDAKSRLQTLRFLEQRLANTPRAMFPDRQPTGTQLKSLQAGKVYNSWPYAMRIVVPDTMYQAMPSAAQQSQEAPGGLSKLPLQQYQPSQPGWKPRTGAKQQAELLKGKP